MLKLPQASVAAKIELDSYVDDQLTGNKARPEAVADMDEADSIIRNGGFRYKSKTYTSNDKPETKVLGVLWDLPTDQLRMPVVSSEYEERQFDINKMRGRGEPAVSVIVDGVKGLPAHGDGLIILEP